jgi:hypothetical protein
MKKVLLKVPRKRNISYVYGWFDEHESASEQIVNLVNLPVDQSPIKRTLLRSPARRRVVVRNLSLRPDIFALKSLPDELLLQIFSYLNTVKDLTSLACVCKRFSFISEDKLLWQDIYDRTYGVLYPVDFDYKFHYMCRKRRILSQPSNGVKSYTKRQRVGDSLSLFPRAPLQQLDANVMDLEMDADLYIDIKRQQRMIEKQGRERKREQREREKERELEAYLAKQKAYYDQIDKEASFCIKIASVYTH